MPRGTTFPFPDVLRYMGVTDGYGTERYSSGGFRRYPYGGHWGGTVGVTPRRASPAGLPPWAQAFLGLGLARPTHRIPSTKKGRRAGCNTRPRPKKALGSPVAPLTSTHHDKKRRKTGTYSPSATP